MTGGEFGLLVALSAWAALDGAAFGQFLVSRPLVVGVLTGVILGDPVTGGLVGGVLELLFLARIPVGATRLPEPGPAAIPAVALVASWPASTDGGPEGAGLFAMAVVLGVAAAWVGGRTVTGQRRMNGRLVERARRKARSAGTAAAQARHLAAAIRASLALDALRGASLTAGWLGLLFVASLTAQSGVGALVDGWMFAPAETYALVGLAALTGLGQLVRIGASGRRSGQGKGPGRAMLRPIALVAAGIGCGVVVAAFLAGVPTSGAAP